jgi:hypothetical protein
MAFIRTKNGALAPSGTSNVRITGIAKGVNTTDVATMQNIDDLQDGTIDLNKIEMATDGTAAAPSITWNSDTDSGYYRIGANNLGISIGGTKLVDMSAALFAVTGAITATTSIAATTTLASTTSTAVGTSLSIGTDVTLAKEVNHSVSVTTSTTAAAAGGNLALAAGTGATSGAGGVMSIAGGAAGATAGAAGGAVNITGGAEGAGTGTTGAVNITTPAATGGAAGNINLTPGTSSSTTIAPLTIISKGKVWKPLSGSVASGGTITGIQIAGGLITATGGTGNWQMPTAAQITTAIGATPAGTIVDFVFNAAGMTATNTATIVVGTNMTVMSAPPITGGGTLTVTQDTQVVGYFRLIYDTATTCKISRIC